MNKLEEYRDKSANDCALGYCESSSEESWAAEISFKSGFDAAIALDLPVKFVEYLFNYHEPYDYVDNPELLKKLYNSWIDKVYKPE